MRCLVIAVFLAAMAITAADQKDHVNDRDSERAAQSIAKQCCTNGRPKT